MSTTQDVLQHLCQQLFHKGQAADSYFFAHENKNTLLIRREKEDCTLKNMSMACLILHKARIDNKALTSDTLFRMFPVTIKELISRTALIEDIPPVGSLELFFFQNHSIINNRIQPVYSWVPDADRLYFDCFFQAPIQTELAASPLYTLSDAASHNHRQVLDAVMLAITTTIDIFNNKTLHSPESIAIFMEKIQPFMTWGGEFDGDGECYIGASGTMSPLFNYLHDFFDIQSESPMNHILLHSRKYLANADRLRIQTAKEYGECIRQQLTNKASIEKYNACLAAFFRLRQMHSKVAMKAISRCPHDYQSTGLTTRIDNHAETLASFRQLNADTRRSFITTAHGSDEQGCQDAAINRSRS